MANALTSVIVTYLDAMAGGDIEGVCSCFTGDATINSPVYGDVSVRPFYERLFADTLSAEINLREIYSAVERPNRFAAHFGYKWVRKSGAMLETDLVDLFEFENGRIARLRIIFDSQPTR
jgi:ketosteroid isomerase-like protein